MRVIRSKTSRLLVSRPRGSVASQDRVAHLTGWSPRDYKSFICRARSASRTRREARERRRARRARRRSRGRRALRAEAVGELEERAGEGGVRRRRGGREVGAVEPGEVARRAPSGSARSAGRAVAAPRRGRGAPRPPRSAAAASGGRVALLGGDEQARCGASRRPARALPMKAESGTARTRPRSAGLIQASSRQEIAPAATARTTPGEHVAAVEAPEERPGHAVGCRGPAALQPLSRPVRIWMTELVCTSIMIGATSAERRSSARRPRTVARRTPREPRLAQEGGGAEELRRVEHQHADAEERHGALGVDARPVGEERPAVEEVVGRHEVGVQRERHAGEEEEEPERRGEVGHHPHEEVQPAQRVQAGGARAGACAAGCPGTSGGRGAASSIRLGGACS